MINSFEIGKIYIHDTSKYEFHDIENPHELICCIDIIEEQCTNPNSELYGQPFYQITVCNVRGEGQTLVQDNLEVPAFYSPANSNAESEFAHKLLEAVLSGNDEFAKRVANSKKERLKRKEEEYEKKGRFSLDDFPYPELYDVQKKYIIESARCTESCGKEYAQKPLQVLLAWQINSRCDMFDNETLLETDNYDEAVEFLKTQYSDVNVVAASGTSYQIDFNIVELAEVTGRYDEDGNWEEEDYTTLAYAPVYPSEPIYTIDMIEHDDEENLINSLKSAGCRIDNEANGSSVRMLY